MALITWDTRTQGDLSESAMTTFLESQGCYVNCYVYPPGTFFPEHTHSVNKIDGVLSGRFRMTMQGKEVILEAGDMLEVPAGVVHSAEVIGTQPVVSLDAVKTR